MNIGTHVFPILMLGTWGSSKVRSVEKPVSHVGYDGKPLMSGNLSSRYMAAHSMQKVRTGTTPEEGC